MAVIDRLADRSTAVTSDLYADVLPMLDDILTRLVLITKDALFFKTLEVRSGLRAVSVIRGELKAVSVIRGAMKVVSITKGGLKAVFIIRGGLKPVSIIRGGLKAVSIIRGEWCSLLSFFIS